MSDLNWCTHCDNAISPSSDSLYCSEKCLRSDALNHHPSLGYKFPEFEHFLKDSSKEELTTIAMPRTGHSRKSFLFEIEDPFPTTCKSNRPSILSISTSSSSSSSSSSSNTSNLFKHNPRHYK